MEKRPLNIQRHSKTFTIKITFKVDDPALLEDEDQAVALNNARMDLQVRTCIKFVKRRNEQDYVFFTDLGLEAE